MKKKHLAVLALLLTLASCTASSDETAAQPVAESEEAVVATASFDNWESVSVSGEASVGSGTKLFPSPLSVIGKTAEDAVNTLLEIGFDPEETCGTPGDYRIPGDLTYATVSADNAEATAQDVARSVWQYYVATVRTHAEPAPEGLLCLAWATTEPMISSKWQDLQELIEADVSLEYLLPSKVYVAGLSAGSALAVACLPPRAYGELSIDDQPMATTLSLSWTDINWRVAGVEDFVAENSDYCLEHLNQVQSGLADDAPAGGAAGDGDTGGASGESQWIIGTWEFERDETQSEEGQ